MVIQTVLVKRLMVELITKESYNVRQYRGIWKGEVGFNRFLIVCHYKTLVRIYTLFLTPPMMSTANDRVLRKRFIAILFTFRVFSGKL